MSIQLITPTPAGSPIWPRSDRTGSAIGVRATELYIELSEPAHGDQANPYTDPAIDTAIIGPISLYCEPGG
jgi:hypothetical protein